MRPNKQGVDYFPFDVHLDTKFKFIEIKFGLEGFAIIVKLLQHIYSEGFWCHWGDDEKLLFSDENKVTPELIEKITIECLERNIFNKKLYEEHEILTSKGIQKRYKGIVRKRYEVEIIKEFLLVDGNFGISDIIISLENNIDNELLTECGRNVGVHSAEDGRNVGVHSAEDGRNVGVQSTQSKVKESKVKKSKVSKPDKPAAKNNDFIDEIIDQFIAEYGSYEIINKGKERAAAAKILQIFKKKFPEKNKNDTLVSLRSYFHACVNIQDEWLKNNMSIPMIVSKFNEINNILRNGKKTNSKGASSRELAEITAKHFSGP